MENENNKTLFTVTIPAFDLIVPSKLNEYPVGITKATIRLGTPIDSMAAIALGNAASEDVVEKAISAGSRVACRNLRSGTRAINATGSKTHSMNTTNAA